MGHRIILVHLDGKDADKYETFAEGWLIGRFKWRRPVNTLVMPDGTILIPDDFAGAIYRITYQNW
jgi:glucose/arabinose dehydrogenase